MEKWTVRGTCLKIQIWSLRKPSWEKFTFLIVLNILHNLWETFVNLISLWEVIRKKGTFKYLFFFSWGRVVERWLTNPWEWEIVMDFLGILYQGKLVIYWVLQMILPSVTGKSHQFWLSTITIKTENSRIRFFIGISTGTRKPILLSNLSLSTRVTLLSSRYALALWQISCCASLLTKEAKQDVAWHNLDENIFASVGDDRQLLMYVPSPHASDL